MLARLTFSILFLCLLVYTTIGSGCGADEMPETEPAEKNAEQKNAAHQLQPQEVFTELRSMFENPILDEDFKTLKQITSSKVYLDFLKQTYPTDKPFEKLAEFVKVAPPVTERYKVFLGKHLENLTDADFVNIHQLALIYRRADMIMMHAEKTGKNAEVVSALKEKINAPREGNIGAWWALRFPGEDQGQTEQFLLNFDKFVTETEKEDTDWIHAQFEAHGQSDGLLWVAIRNPVLMGEILTNCSSTDAFWTWVEQTFILQKLAELEKNL